MINATPSQVDDFLTCLRVLANAAARAANVYAISKFGPTTRQTESVGDKRETP